MRVFAPQSAEKDSSSSRHHAVLSQGLPAPVAFRSNSHSNGIFLQRKSNCACGGGCPGCAREKQPETVQTKLQVSTPGDQYEQEADIVADLVMRMPNATIQRACAGCSDGSTECPDCKSEVSDTVQRKAEGVSGSLGYVSDNLLSYLGSGQPLDSGTRDFFEPRFGRDFAHIRLHSDEHATASAHELAALAYTVGNHVVVDATKYSSSSDAGRRLLAHELTHAIQQRSTAFPDLVTSSVPDNRNVATRAPRFATGQTSEISSHQTGAVLQRLGDPTRKPSDVLCETAQSTVTPSDSVMFPNRVSTLSSSARALIRHFVEGWRNSGGNVHVRVDGFASQPGTEELNWRLSCERAEAVARELMNPSSGIEGIPQGFINVVAHGQTSSRGADAAANRRADITLGPAPGPSPPVPVPPVSPPAHPTVTDESCRRARQVECVKRLGGCANTRAGGIPSPEEIMRYNLECRSGTGYEGGDATPTPEECTSRNASPTPSECQRLAEESMICGPDITQPLAGVLANVRSTFSTTWSRTQQREACDAISGIPIPFVTSGFIMAWDIRDLFLQGTGWLCQDPYHPPCGMPPATNCDDENANDCGNSVQVRDKCFLAGTVNYALIGQICRLCNDRFGVLSESTMENLILGWKMLGLLLDDPGPPTSWARAAFRGFPGNIPATGNRAFCRGRCPVPYTSGPFSWVWEPHRPR
jgi:outer membrane protein OmpA-like peptidoglycan-associated protein